MQRNIRLFTCLLFGLVLVGSIAAQEAATDNLNLYYRYPLAGSVDFHTWTPFSDYNGPYTVYEVGASLRYPIPTNPVFQPLLRSTYVRFDSLDEADSTKWDHTHAGAGLGLALVNRMTRTFEIGIETVAEYSRTRFPNVWDEPVGYNNFIASLSPRISLIPSFNFAINLIPTLRYSRAFGAVNEFDGFSFSLGIGGEFRFGQDPDAAQSQIRSIRISEPRVDTVFAAMQSYYVDHPIGTVTIENTENHELTDVQVAFFQNGYMDSPTPSARIESLAPGESREIGLQASYNREIFATEGVTPLSGEVIITYESRGRPAEQRQSVTYDLHDKTALTWTDDRKMGSFITPADSAVRNYTSFVRQAGKDRTVDSASDPLQTAMLAYHALIELGVIYQVDPASPFAQVQQNQQVVDSVSLPRDTLTRRTGDCDDLTALYCTMLETAGIETAFLTTPGHIYVAFNTGVPPRDHRIVHPNREMLLTIEDELWVPVEITMLGRGDFLEAWRFGVDEWRKYDDEVSKRGFYTTSEAQAAFRPVGLRERDLGLQYGSASRIASGFAEEFRDLTNIILADLRQRAEDRDDRRAYNLLGIYAARLEDFDEARAAFRQAARMDANYIDPLVNLGSLQFLQEDYDGAQRSFRDALDAYRLTTNVPQSLGTKIYINLSRANYQMGQFEDAERYYELAAQSSDGDVAEFQYLAEAASDGTRASEAASGPLILFADETPAE